VIAVALMRGAIMAISGEQSAGPSLDDDRSAICGLWLLSRRPGLTPLTMYISRRVVKICDFGEKVYRVN
jgi:hypothetical protein